MEAKVLEVRAETGWGGRKLARLLHNQGYTGVPHPNTITDILRRAGKLDEAECDKHTPLQRFERNQPNELWQMDFKGHFEILNGRCHPLTVLDDHSRFCVGSKPVLTKPDALSKDICSAFSASMVCPKRSYAITADRGAAGIPSWS
jgi:transposase InsO family protein